MNALGQRRNAPKETNLINPELLKLGMDAHEVDDLINSTPSFSYVVQEEWSNVRLDGVEGNHFNLIQLPNELEVDEHGFSFNYQIALAFDNKDCMLTNEQIIVEAKTKLKVMESNWVKVWLNLS